MLKASAALVCASSLFGCATNPNSLRIASEFDGRWAVSATSPDCAIDQEFGADVSGRAFGVRIPGTEIYLSGVIRQNAVRTDYSAQDAAQYKGSTKVEIAETILTFNDSKAAKGTWRTSNCSGFISMLKLEG